MTDTITAAHFEAALDAAPDAWGVRLQYADWLDERGWSYEAMAQRWMVKHELAPQQRPWDFCERWNLGAPPKGNAYPWALVTNAMRSNGNAPGAYRESRQECEAVLADALRYLHTEVLGLPSLEG